jgi:aldehyde dehydrogenase
MLTPLPAHPTRTPPPPHNLPPLSPPSGQKVMEAAVKSIIPVTMELGGKSPMIFMPSVGDKDDAFFDKAIEGAVMFALNQGEICTCPR